MWRAKQSLNDKKLLILEIASPQRAARNDKTGILAHKLRLLTKGERNERSCTF